MYYRSVRRPSVVLFGIWWFTIGWASPAEAATRTWIGGNVDWIDNGATNNWSPADEPDPDDEAIFNTANSVNLGSNNSILALTLSGGIDLFTNGNDLAVDGLLQLSGSGTSLFVGGAASELNADNLTINSSGVLELTGGSIVVDEESGTGLLQINAAGTFAGHGALTFADTPILATTLLRNEGALTALSRGLTIFTPPPVGTLTINDASIGGRVDLDGAGTAGVVNVNRNQTLDINVPLSDNFAGTMNLFHNATFDMSTAWTMDGGAIFVDNGFVDNSLPNPDIPADVSTIAGATFTQTGGTINVVDTDGTLRFDAPFSMSGGTITNNGLVMFNADTTITSGGSITMPTTSSSFTVGAGRHVQISLNNFDLDGGNAVTNIITVNAGGALLLGTTDYDPDSATNRYDGTLNLNSGSIQLSVTDATFVMDGVLNMDSSSGFAANWSGKPLTIGNDAGVLDADLNVLGGGFNELASNVTFNSDADVDIAAGSHLRFIGTATATFNTVSGGSHAQFTGAGTLEFNNALNFNEAVTFNMSGGTINLTGSDATGATTNIDAPVVINVANFGSFGNANGVGGPDTLDIDALTHTGSLTVNLDNPDAEWTLTAPGVMNLKGGNSTLLTLLDGSGVILNGTTNVTGAVGIGARADIGGTVNILTTGSNTGLVLEGGVPLVVINNLDIDVNRLVGGTINGPGTLRAGAATALLGFGTINTAIDFGGTSRIYADNGTLTINGPILDAASIGSIDADGVLEVTSPWNTTSVGSLDLVGGEVRGATITNDASNGITAIGINGTSLLSARVINNTVIDATSGGTFVIETVGHDNDWDGTTNTGEIKAFSGSTIELRDNATFGFTGSVTANNSSSVFANGFALDFNLGSTLALRNDGTYKSTHNTHIGGTVTVGSGTGATIEASMTFEPTSVTMLDADLRLVSNFARINAGATFSGTGAIVIPSQSEVSIDANANINVLVVNEGNFRPVFDSVGRVDVRDYEQAHGGHLFVELTGTALNEFDRLVVNGTALLDGSVHIRLDSGFVPSLGQTFNVVSATAGVTGQFTTVSQPVNLPAGLIVDVVYAPTMAQLRVLPNGDFNLDGNFTCADVDALTAQIAAGITLPSLDMNGDGLANNADLTLWLLRAGAINLPSGNPYLPGDANLDGVVDGSDFLAWNSHKFTPTTGWCAGNFNADSVVDGSDFLIWNSHKFLSSDQSQVAVPEPTGCILILLSLIGGRRFRVSERRDGRHAER